MNSEENTEENSMETEEEE